LIGAKFYFKQVELTIVVVYIPPSDKEKTRKLQQRIVNMYIERASNSQFIVMGDFNYVVDSKLDKLSSSKNNCSRTLPLHKWIMRQGFGDTYRICNPELRGFTWTGNDIQTRIDQIWITEDLQLGLEQAEIVDAEYITSSDHNIVCAMLMFEHLIQTHSVAEMKKKDITRTIYLYDKATKEN
jgi:exonuclease III